MRRLDGVNVRTDAHAGYERSRSSMHQSLLSAPTLTFTGLPPIPIATPSQSHRIRQLTLSTLADMMPSEQPPPQTHHHRRDETETKRMKQKESKWRRRKENMMKECKGHSIMIDVHAWMWGVPRQCKQEAGSAPATLLHPAPYPISVSRLHTIAKEAARRWWP